MTELPKDRVEIVLKPTEAAPIRLWVQAPSGFARHYDYDRDKSLKILGGAGVFLLLMLYFAPAATVFLALVGLMVVFPMSLVGMMGYSRIRSPA
jgi:hypothetical protein